MPYELAAASMSGSAIRHTPANSSALASRVVRNAIHAALAYGTARARWNQRVSSAMYHAPAIRLMTRPYHSPAARPTSEPIEDSTTSGATKKHWS